jgi:hypothetical protein
MPARTHATQSSYARSVAEGITGTVVARLYARCPTFHRGPDVTSWKRFTLTLAAAAAFTLGSGIPARAQIGYPFPPYRYPNTSADSSVRLDVTPRDAEVYIDSYYAGVVDDFDGVFQRLRVEPGQHEITLYRDGYRAVHQRVYLARDRTFKIKQQMEKLSAGEAGEPRPIPPPATAGVRPPAPLPRNGRGGPRTLPPPDARPDAGSPADGQPATGRLTIQVQPADATVLIDGQPWPASPGQDTVVLDLSEGRHVIQVRKAGYVGYLTEIDVRRAEASTVNVMLRAQP